MITQKLLPFVAIAVVVLLVAFAEISKNKAIANPLSQSLEQSNPRTLPSPTRTFVPLQTPIPSQSRSLPHPPLGLAWWQWTNHSAASVADNFIVVATYELVATYEIATGKERWNRKYSFADGTLIYGMATSKHLIVIVEQANDKSQFILRGLDLTTGRSLWQFKVPSTVSDLSRLFSRQIIIDANQIYYMDLLANELMDIDFNTQQVRWKRKDCFSLQGLVNGHLFASCGYGMITELDKNTGQVIHGVFKNQVDTFIPIGFVDDIGPNIMVSIGWDDLNHSNWQITAYDWQNNSRLWQQLLPGRTLGGYVYDHSHLAIRIDQRVIKLDLKNGEKVWETILPEDTGAAMLLSDNNLYVLGQIGYLHQIEWQTGFYLWRENLQRIFGQHWGWRSFLTKSDDKLIFDVVFQEESFADFGIAALTANGTISWASPTPRSTPTSLPTPQPPDFEMYLGTLIPPPNKWTPTPILVPFATQQPSSGFVLADLDGDGDDDWIVNFPALYLDQHIRWPITDNPDLEHMKLHCQNIRYCPWAVVIFEHQGSVFKPVFNLDNSRIMGRMDSADIIWVDDLNGDNFKEVIVHDTTCGSACSYINYVLSRTKDQGWSVNSTFYGNSLDVIDQENDGIPELIAHQPMFCGMTELGARPLDQVYRWQNDHYILTQTIEPPFPFIYYRLKDSFAALQKKDLDKALELLGPSITNPERGIAECMSLHEIELKRAASFAGILAMLVYGSKNEIGAMLSVLNEIEQRYSDPENPYIPAARQLLAIYDATYNIAVACEAMATYLAEHQQTTSFTHDYARRVPTCPLTDTTVWKY